MYRRGSVVFILSGAIPTVLKMSGHVKTNQELNASQKSVAVLTEPVNKQLSANACVR
jgi:hypothetical protein